MFLWGKMGYNRDMNVEELWKSLEALATPERVSEAMTTLGEKKVATGKGLRGALALAALGRTEESDVTALAAHAGIAETSARGLLERAAPLAEEVLREHFPFGLSEGDRAALSVHAPALPEVATTPLATFETASVSAPSPAGTGDPSGERLAMAIAPPLALLVLGGLGFALARGCERPSFIPAAMLPKASAPVPVGYSTPVPVAPSEGTASPVPSPTPAVPLALAQPTPVASPTAAPTPEATPAPTPSPAPTAESSPEPTPEATVAPEPTPTPGPAVPEPVGDVETKLLEFLKDPNRAPDRDTWFDFDNLLFDTNKATLRGESMAQLDRIGAILKAFPKVHVKIGGYTDNIGDEQGNLRLSTWRAQNIRDALLNRGIVPERMEFEGYGEQHPIASNDSEEGRAKNRRISIRVTKK
jgi:outer membrane protein OmpA-like peptidoglycan-associated protein